MRRKQRSARAAPEGGARAGQARAALLGALAALWALPPDRVEWLAQLHKPELRTGLSEVAIGRAVLPVVAEGGTRVRPIGDAPMHALCRAAFAWRLWDVFLPCQRSRG